MKNSLRLFAITALLASASAFAQDSAPGLRDRQFLPPAVLNSDGSITLPDGSVLLPLPGPMFNSDGSLTLPDGTVVQPPTLHTPPVKNADGSLTLPDGTVVQPNSDGTYTLPDGHVIDLSKAPPAPPRRDPGRGRGHRGPPPSGG